MTKEEICNICGMVGIDDDHDIYDCTEKWEEDNGIRKGQWMIDWMKRLAEKEKKEGEDNHRKSFKRNDVEGDDEEKEEEEEEEEDDDGVTFDPDDYE